MGCVLLAYSKSIRSVCQIELIFGSYSVGNNRPCNLQQKYLDQCPRILGFPQAHMIGDGRLVAEIELYTILQDLLQNTQYLRFGETRHEPINQWRSKWKNLFSMPCLPLTLRPFT